MTDDLLLLWLTAFPLMGSPGPAAMSLAAIGAAFGARAGLPYLLGISVGTFGVLLLIATGITGLILAQPVLVTLITIVAAAYILYLAYRIATAPVIADDHTEIKPPSFYGGAVLSIANPKAYAAIGATYSNHKLVPHDLVLDAVTKIGALSIVIITVSWIWLVFGSALSARLRHPKTGRIANIVFAGLLVASVALVWFGG